MNTTNLATDLHTLDGDDHALIVITKPGTYILNKDLRAAPGKAGIRIDADNVTIDLCGFCVEGCVDSRDGITVTTLAANISIKNGDVCGWGEDGVDLCNAVGTTVSQVRIYDNGGLGLLIGSGATIEQCSLDRNRGYGAAAWSRR